MWLYFDKNGNLLEILEHGSQAYSGTTNFQIFAYFEDTVILGNYERDGAVYPEASIKLYKPDLYGTSTPTILMDKKVDVPFVLQEGEHSKYFENGEKYTGYLLDFNTFLEGEDKNIVVVLDTPGVWRAVITLISSQTYNVVGNVVFNVQPGINYEDDTTMPLDVVLNQVYWALSKKLGADTKSLMVRESELYTPEKGYRLNTLYFVKMPGTDTPYVVKFWNGTEYEILGMINLSAYASKEEFDRLENSVANQIDAFNERLTIAEQQAASGGPSGVYATVQDLINADPNHNGIYLVKEDNAWYYWGGSTWLRGGPYTAPSTVLVNGRTIVLNDTSSASDQTRTIVLEL